MDKVESIEQLKELIAYVRSLRQGFVTNFYLDEEKHAAWIRTGEFQYDKWEDTVFLLFDLNATLYLRYWLVLPEYRNQGVGSELFRQFLWEGRETKQQILWVNQANENSIVRYEHYGFKKENMCDYIIRYC